MRKLELGPIGGYFVSVSLPTPGVARSGRAQRQDIAERSLLCHRAQNAKQDEAPPAPPLPARYPFAPAPTIRLHQPRLHQPMLRVEHRIIPNTYTTQFHRVRAWLTFEEICDHFGKNKHVAETMIEHARERRYGFEQYRIIEYYVVVKTEPYRTGNGGRYQ